MPRDMEKRRAWYRARYHNIVREQRLALYRQHRANGICTNCCCRTARPGKGTCEYCGQYNRRKSLEYIYKMRNAAYQAYGGYVCSCCGETETTFLTIDHINGDGNKHRKEISKTSGSTSLYVWLAKNNYPPGFQILCYNCNSGRWRSPDGICPHQKKKILNASSENHT